MSRSTFGLICILFFTLSLVSVAAALQVPSVAVCVDKDDDDLQWRGGHTEFVCCE